MRSPLRLLLLVFAVISVGCAPQIGDGCNNSFDCSINGDRQCDLSQPSGACTIFGCDADTCPDDAVCVRFRPEPSRLTFTACMKPCETDASCRVSEDFICLSANEVLATEGPGGGEGDVIAEIVDEERGERSFCISVVDPANYGR
ncbi:MAG: hypothetical protein EVA89_26820 [Sandaracinaceae bacterium]|nr:MAG: hypothetical protein EVA89_26820 [Sandaracinaceae bacterium]